jgi:hypothetical protein
MSPPARPSHRAWSACVLVIVLAGCGTASSPGDAGGGAGSGGGGSSGGGSGGGGAAAANCPGAAPIAGQTCNVAASCFYEDCGASGRTVATCANGAWNVETGACTGVFCHSQTCAVGQVCLMLAGGALLVDCVANTCGTGAIGCGCLQSCAGSCAVTGSIQTGVTIQCNTCPSNQCA